MKSCPTHAVASSKIHNVFDTASSLFQTGQPSLSHTYSIIALYKGIFEECLSDIYLLDLTEVKHAYRH